MSQDNWIRTKREIRCPICGKNDWCLVARDETAAICMRISEGSIKDLASGGYLHRLMDSDDWLSRQRRPECLELPIGADFGPMSSEFRKNAGQAEILAFAKSLGVSGDSLVQLGVGKTRQGAWSFPMRNAHGRVVGIRLRGQDGSKYAVKGSRDGLFCPDMNPDPNEHIYIVEGASDCAAALTIGFSHVIGRPSCTGGVSHIVDLVRKRKPIAIAIVSDADEPGQRGAMRLACLLRLYCRVVKVIIPPLPHKDLRAWLQSGGTKQDVLDQICMAREVEIKYVGR